MPARLVERGERSGTVYELAAASTAIGREPDNDVVLAVSQVSRHHARLEWDGRRYLLRDLGSKNGTLVNGERLVAPRALQDGDQITFPGRPPLVLGFESSEVTVSVSLDELTPRPEPRPAIWLDTRTGELCVGERRQTVSPKEFLALGILCDRRGGIVRKDDLARHVWPEYQGAVSDDSMEQIISRLRRKIEADPEHPKHVLTVRGLGYRLVQPEAV
jgi:hypothetical protein